MKPDPRSEDTASITKAIHDAAEDARALHRAFGCPLIVWEDGRVQFLDPDTLEPMENVTLPELPPATPPAKRPRGGRRRRRRA